MKQSRRTVLVAVALLACVVIADAQQPGKSHRIGVLDAGTPSNARNEAFRLGLRELGYAEGKNFVVEWRYAEGKLDRLPMLAAELVRLQRGCHRYLRSDTDSCG